MDRYIYYSVELEIIGRYYYLQHLRFWLLWSGLRTNPLNDPIL